MRINNIEIKLLGDTESRVELTNELLEFEDKVTESYSSKINEKLPFVQDFNPLGAAGRCIDLLLI